MRLKARPGNPGFSVLTCSAFSFYPPELQLRFLRNGLAAGTGQGDFGPNSDGSFHASSSLTVKSGDEHHYCCIVQHAGLAQPLRVELGEAPPGGDAPGFPLPCLTAAPVLPESDLPPRCCHLLESDCLVPRACQCPQSLMPCPSQGRLPSVLLLLASLSLKSC